MREKVDDEMVLALFGEVRALQNAVMSTIAVAEAISIPGIAEHIAKMMELRVKALPPHLGNNSFVKATREMARELRELRPTKPPS